MKNQFKKSLALLPVFFLIVSLVSCFDAGIDDGIIWQEYGDETVANDDNMDGGQVTSLPEVTGSCTSIKDSLQIKCVECAVFFSTQFYRYGCRMPSI